jgi:hypothetical protein
MTGLASFERVRPAATLSLDLDNLWCYQRSFGLETWRDYGSFLEIALPRILDILDSLDLRLTLFVIGRDAAQEAHKPILAEAARRGHEIASHSYEHDIGLHRWPRERAMSDLRKAADAIEDATGHRPQGFRGPAYGLSTTLLESLIELGYAYDASSFPSSLGFLTRLYQRRKAARFDGCAQEEQTLYDTSTTAGRRLEPFRWQVAGTELIEVPVTTLPFLRLPFHGTYLHHLGDLSIRAADRYFRAALGLCRLRAVPPSLLLHLTDFIGADEVPALAFLPGMKRAGAAKADFMTAALHTYEQEFAVQPIGPFVAALRSSHALPRLAPAFGA